VQKQGGAVHKNFLENDEASGKKQEKSQRIEAYALAIYETMGKWAGLDAPGFHLPLYGHNLLNMGGCNYFHDFFYKKQR
jgi:hypothetical protein